MENEIKITLQTLYFLLLEVQKKLLIHRSDPSLCVCALHEVFLR